MPYVELTPPYKSEMPTKSMFFKSEVAPFKSRFQNLKLHQYLKWPLEIWFQNLKYP